MFGIIAEVVLLIFFEKKIAAYGPVIFWAICIFGMINYVSNIFKLSKSVKMTNPSLFKKNSFGKILTRNSLTDKVFLNALNESELKIFESNKIIFKSQLLCFGLFAVSAILIALK